MENCINLYNNNYDDMSCLKQIDGENHPFKKFTNLT